LGGSFSSAVAFKERTSAAFFSSGVNTLRTRFLGFGLALALAFGLAFLVAVLRAALGRPAAVRPVVRTAAAGIGRPAVATKLRVAWAGL